MKVLVAGGGTAGHLTPALAIAEGLRRARPDIEPVIVGSERGIERDLLPSRGFRFHLLPAEPLYRRQWWKNLRWLHVGPRLIRATDRLLDAERPAAVLGTGGYAAGSVLWRASSRAIPTAVHEANAFPGLVTRLMATRVDHMYLGFADAQEALPSGRRGAVYVTGNPVRPPAAIGKQEALDAFGFRDDRTVLLVTGGSQGALSINRAVCRALETGRLDGVNLIWSTGKRHVGRYESMAVAGQVFVASFLDPIDQAYAAADVAVTRAGAMTVAELAAWGLPAILVPLPTAAQQHQLFNARSVERGGAAVVLEEDDLTDDRLAEVVMGLHADPARLASMREQQLACARPDAARIVVSRLLTLVP